MIRSFRGKWAEAILVNRIVPKGFPTGLAAVARRKLVQLNNAVVLGDLAVPPGNKLEALKGNLSGRYARTDQRPMANCLSLDTRRP